MSDNSLQRFNPQNFEPDLSNLPPEKQLEIRTKMATEEADIRARILKKVGDSTVAEHDMKLVIDQVESLDAEGKMYNVKQSIETGSGKVDVGIRGGRYLIPVITIIAFAILMALVILKLL